MNARQKAKKYKKAYEDLLKRQAKHYVVNYPVDTLHFKKNYPMEMVDSCSKDNYERFEELVRNDIKQGFINGIEPYIDWRFDKDIPNDLYVLNCQLKVVSRNKTISSLADGVLDPLIMVERG